MKRIEVFISEGDADKRLGKLEYDEMRGKEVSSFELDGDTIKATFDEGTKTEFYIQREDGLIKTIKLGYDEYTVYFGASANNNQ